MLEVLKYIFENYVDSGAEFSPDETILTSHLLEAGFQEDEIGRISRWLEKLATLQASIQKHRPHGGYAVRVYTAEECKKLNVECRGFLLILEQAGVLSPLMREIILDRIMVIEGAVTLEQLKWIVILVLFHKPGQAAIMAEMEEEVPLQKNAVVLN